VERVFASAPRQPSPEQTERLLLWLAAVDEWNQKIDLTAARDDEQFVDLMLADASLLSGALRRDKKVVDIGTGAGAPGLGLALLRPDLQVRLVEPKQKRAALLRLVIGQVSTSAALAAEVMQVPAERIVAPKFDVALSRATLPPQQWLELGASLAPDGQVWVLLAQQPAPALSAWHVVEDLRYQWPLTGVERRAVCFRRHR